MINECKTLISELTELKRLVECRCRPMELKSNICFCENVLSETCYFLWDNFLEINEAVTLRVKYKIVISEPKSS
jgi:hypothetical protein